MIIWIMLIFYIIEKIKRGKHEMIELFIYLHFFAYIQNKLTTDVAFENWVFIFQYGKVNANISFMFSFFVRNTHKVN